MNLLARFSLIFILVFESGLAVVCYCARQYLQASAQKQVQEQARLMMDTALAVRRYTQTHIQPILSSPDVPSTKFHRERVPAFAATEVFLDLRGSSKDYADYSYKEAVLNPTNPRDQARGWEEDIVNEFRNHPELKQLNGQRANPTGDLLYLARPLVLNPKDNCLMCHGQRDEAPPEMIKEYNLAGTVNGFGWKEGETIGAQIVSVPLSKPVTLAESAFRELMFWLVIGGFVTLAILAVTLQVAVIRPIQGMAGKADAISKGQTGIPELPVTGAREISMLAAAFNRMHRSLEKAMKLLDEQ